MPITLKKNSAKITVPDGERAAWERNGFVVVPPAAPAPTLEPVAESAPEPVPNPNESTASALGRVADLATGAEG